jgi:hypothetical protein
MIPYATLSNFYTGVEKTSFTPMNSEYLNSIIFQISENDNTLDKRVENVESIISDGEITNEIINTQKINSTDIITKNLSCDQGMFVNSLCTLVDTKDLRAVSSSIETLTVSKIIGKNSQIEDAKIKNAYIDNIFTDSFSISENYKLEEEQIVFDTDNIGVIFNSSDNKTSGIRYQNLVDGFSSSLDIICDNTDINNSYISFKSENPRDSFGIKSTNDFYIDSENIKVTNIIPLNGSSNIGSSTDPFDTIESKKITGSYYSRTEADIAEEYETDNIYSKGSLLQIGTDTEGTIHKGGAVLGIVSDSYGYLLNSDFRDTKKFSASIALKGRVFVKLSNQGKRGLFVEPDLDNPGYCIATPKRSLDTLGVLINKDTIKV